MLLYRLCNGGNSCRQPWKCHITLKEDTEEQDEVLVIGYGTAKKKDLTGAISV